MKVCLIYDFLTELGGLEREIVNHARMLVQEGHDVEILTCFFDRGVLNKLGFNKLKVTNISLIKTRSEFLSLIFCFLGLNKLKKYNPDLFISYSFPSNYLIRNKCSKKLFYINHYPHFLYLSGLEAKEWAQSTVGLKRKISLLIGFFFRSYLKKLDKILVKKNNLNIVNSYFTQKRLKKIYETKMKVIYPPVDPVFKPSKKLIKDKFIFCPGRIIPDKKYELLIEAMFYMKNKTPLYLSGQGEKKYKKHLLELAKFYNVDLKFLGHLSTKSLIRYYSSALCCAFPTPKEDFGLVPAESLSCGTPCVAWNDGGGPTEQIINGVTGFLAKAYDLKDFSKKLDLCIEKNLKKNKKRILSCAKKFSFAIIKNQFIKEIKKI